MFFVILPGVEATGRRIFMELSLTYDMIAREWTRDHASDTWWIPGTSAFMSYLNPGAKILDVGCGSGVKTRFLVDGGFKVTGIDFSSEMIGLAARTVPEADFRMRDIMRPLGLPREYDAVFAQAVLLHIPKRSILQVIRNITEPLRKDGLLYVAFKKIRPGPPKVEVVKENDYGYEYERFFSYYSLREMLDYLELLGMEVLVRSLTPSGGTTWIQAIARKTS
jgi:SAM-dependent methyltransferase